MIPNTYLESHACDSVRLHGRPAPVRDFAGLSLMPLWIVISIAAAFLQNARTALQKTLTPRVGIIGATYARFLFAAPWAAHMRRITCAARSLKKRPSPPRIRVLP